MAFMPARTESQLSSAAISLFREHFGSQPPGVWAAPGRVNLIGDHVDYAGGMSIPFALAQCTAVAVELTSDGVFRVVSQQTAGGETWSSKIVVRDVGPGPPSSWAGYAVGPLWAGREIGVLPPVNGAKIAIVSDVPVGAGLSSSAALECSVALAAFELGAGRAPSTAETQRLIEACIVAENEVVGASTGGLDQRSSFLGEQGKALAMDFATGGVQTVPFDIAGHGLSVLIANTNAPHSLSDGQYGSRRGLIDAVSDALGTDALADFSDAIALAARWAESEPALEVLGPLVGEEVAGAAAERSALVAKRVRHVVEETERTRQAMQWLQSQKFGEFGELMVDSHESLRDLYEVSTPELDGAVEAALRAGARGARMTGGGFGGSIVALVESATAADVAGAIESAARQAGHPRPTFICAMPSQGAHRIRS